MLELRPTCENCNKALPPDSMEAMICSYECTFCETCVQAVLEDICPNCGGGFSHRPVRPAQDRKDGNYLGNNPASTTIRHKPIDLDEHQALVNNLKNIPASKR